MYSLACKKNLPFSPVFKCHLDNLTTRATKNPLKKDYLIFGWLLTLLLIFEKQKKLFFIVSSIYFYSEKIYFYSLFSQHMLFFGFGFHIYWVIDF